MQNQHNHWTRRLAALACLVAVLLLQTPFARATWLATLNCCMSDHCPIPGHHHKSAPAKENMPMDCDHGTNHQNNGKISCCKTTDETAINIEPFVLPDADSVLTSNPASPDMPHFAPQMISRSGKPQSPPPKSFLS